MIEGFRTGLIDNSSLSSNCYRIATRHIDELILYCINLNKHITNLSFHLHLRLDEALPFQKHYAEFELFFINEQEYIVSEIETLLIPASQTVQCQFTLYYEMATQKLCYLAIRSRQDKSNTLQQKIPFQIQIISAIDCFQNII